VSADPVAVAQWCREQGARVVAVDAPCRWSADGKARPAEQELRRDGIQCFATPSLESALGHPRDYYGWMLAGAALFKELERTHPLYGGGGFGEACCFESFPHAIAWMLAGGRVSAREKRVVRTRLLEAAGVRTEALTSMDLLDAGLCALTAHRAVSGVVHAYGASESGWIIVPKMRVVAVAQG